MTDWENYKSLCSLKDNVSSVCRSVQTDAYSNFHHFLFQYPLDYYGEEFIRDLCKTYNQIHFNPIISNIELITDLIDTPPQVLTSGMAMNAGRAISVSGSVAVFDNFIDNSIIRPNGVTINTVTIKRVNKNNRIEKYNNTSSLWGKFIRKLTFSKTSDDI